MYKSIEIPQLELKVKQPVGLFINNEFVKSSDGETIESINPSTNKRITSFYAASEEDVDSAVQAASAAYRKVWSKTSPADRNKLLYKLSTLIEREKTTLAALDAIDAGKPYHSNALQDIEQVLDLTRYFAGSADKYTHGEVIPLNDEKYAYTIKAPFGVVAQIVPWNYPFAMASWKMQGALAAGNCIIIKPADNTSLSLLYAAQLFKEAGFPPGVVNVLPGLGNVTGTALCKHPRISKISFTGSTAVGGKVLESSGQSNLKDVTLECGGKSPAVVFADCDLDKAVEWTASGIFYNSGQNCTANSRIYVQEAVYDDFLKRFRKHVSETWTFGSKFDVFDPECTVGPVVSETQFKRIHAMTNAEQCTDDDNPSEWVKTQTCEYPTESQSKGFFIPPTIFTNVKQSSSLMQNEIFGPVVVVAPFKEYDEAIELANDSDYGLASAVFTKNITTAHRFARDIQAGTCWINSSNDEDVTVPFGGYKMSGIGRELGAAGVETYLQTKAVHVNLE
ncbi:uncharacterized protein KNAG_0I00770 [Huiozyma naganishii CBS 8797]|uniref:Aldehyde dehydrogenase domain-containing protein n=1 Tax=Huiozyma naganishii (strain ATCC MYA-139 / BCRC 22969 / CBS 8797 / KCTC 17520 / NBRC 10181 / NCYC 3082 / Yp74L-3) TaxID=1071383 RepID=J7RQ25_HUIN7|nr:hypothetical protein KNAG_0I00770 [Kazachstania naganishii CBS 8797]CCK71868.1 hypothetical protein KNAG_0I00770 [Kazachstania naganishii CBS 8797]